MRLSAINLVSTNSNVSVSASRLAIEADRACSASASSIPARSSADMALSKLPSAASANLASDRSLWRIAVAAPETSRDCIASVSASEIRARLAKKARRFASWVSSSSSGDSSNNSSIESLRKASSCCIDATCVEASVNLRSASCQDDHKEFRLFKFSSKLPEISKNSRC